MNKNIYVELDGLIDTRIATAALLDPKSVGEFVRNGKYRNRVTDNYGNVSYYIFKDLYARRNKNILYMGLPTPLIYYVKEHFGDMFADIKDIQRTEPISIYVNHYPYKLLDSELKYLTAGIAYNIPKAKIENIRLSPKELTPSWIITHVGIMFMYDALPWINYHLTLKNTIYNPLVNTYCVAPAIYNNNVLKQTFDRERYFKDLEAKFNSIVLLQFAAARIFSMSEFKE